MKKLVFMALFAGALAFGQSKKVVESDVQWWGYKIAKTASSSHTGTISVKAGTITLKNNKIIGGNFVFDMNSINATDVSGDSQMKLNKHLKDGDFFEVEKFPVASFKITAIKDNPDKIYNSKITGDLTIKGKTSRISFPAKVSVDNGTVTIESDKFSFDRQKFNVAYQSSLKDVMIKDDVDMKVSVTAK